MGVTGGAAAAMEVHGPKVSLKEAGRGIAAVDTAHWLFLVCDRNNGNHFNWYYQYPDIFFRTPFCQININHC